MQSSDNVFTTSDGIRIAYRLDGRPDLPILLLSNSIATDLHMWDGQVDLLGRHFRLLRYDARGHGRSDAPAGSYSFDRLGRDAVELLDALAIERVHMLGLSLGGIVAQWMGIHVPERIERLVLSNTAAYLGPPSSWTATIEQLTEARDMEGTADMFLRNWFPAELLDTESPVVRAFRETLLSTPRAGIAGSWAAIRDADFRRTIRLIDRPTLVIAGQHDTVTSVAHARELAEAIPDAHLEILPSVHLPNVQVAEAFVGLVVRFLLQADNEEHGVAARVA